MSVVLTSHKRHLSVPDSFKSCVASKNARTDGGRELETSLEYFTAKIKEVWPIVLFVFVFFLSMK